MRGRGRACIVLGGLAVGLVAGGAGAENPGRSVIAGVASAQGIRATMRATGFIVEELADSGGPVAQALVDLQDSKSFASLPYPGDNAVAVPGVIAAVGGPTLPPYPFYASASTSAPEQEVVDPSGGYRLQAKAAAGSATGDAALQGGGQQPVSGAWSTATVTTRGDGADSRAEAVVRGLSLGSGALRIATLRSLSETTYQPGNPDPKTSSQLLIEGGTAGPLSFTYGPDGLSVADHGVPVPAHDALTTLNQGLKPAGLSVSITAAQDIPGGRSSEALVVDQAGDIANGSRSFIRYRIGEATSAIVLGDAVAVPPTDAALRPVVAAPAPGSGPTAEAAASPGPTSAAVTSAPLAIPGRLFSSSTPPVATTGTGAGSGVGGSGPPSGLAISPSGSDATSMSNPAMLGEPAATFPVTPRRISATEPLSGLLVAAAAAMVALALLWTKRGALTP